jgi:hypothetical protein
MKIKDINIFNTLESVFEKKTMVKSVIYLLFSYQTGYIICYSALRQGISVGKQTHDLTVIASDSKTTQSGGDNRKKSPLGAALQVPQNFSFAPL